MVISITAELKEAGDDFDHHLDSELSDPQALKKQFTGLST